MDGYKTRLYLDREPNSEASVLEMQESHETGQSQNLLLLRRLSRAVDGHAATATFACGGSLPLRNVPVNTIEPGKRSVCSPIKIRWDADLDNPASITFPSDGDIAKFNLELKALLQKCQPATFGIGGQDVLDEGYRKASKLDTSSFSTNFHPHDCGIIDSIQQVLMPSTIRGGQGIGIGPQGVRAELYSLNVCTWSFSTLKPDLLSLTV